MSDQQIEADKKRRDKIVNEYNKGSFLKLGHQNEQTICKTILCTYQPCEVTSIRHKREQRNSMYKNKFKYNKGLKLIKK